MGDYQTFFGFQLSTVRTPLDSLGEVPKAWVILGSNLDDCKKFEHGILFNFLWIAFYVSTTIVKRWLMPKLLNYIQRRELRLSFAISAFFLVPLKSVAADQCSAVFKDVIIYYSKMQDRRQLTLKQGLEYLFGRSLSKQPSSQESRTEQKSINAQESRVEKVSKIEKMMEARNFKTWFDFSNPSARSFAKDLKFKRSLIKPVGSEQEGLLAKLMMIRQAQHTVDLSYYIFKNDESGYAVLNELKDAVKRGVSVRIIVDSLGSINPKLATHRELKALIDFAEKEGLPLAKLKFGS